MIDILLYLVTSILLMLALLSVFIDPTLTFILLTLFVISFAATVFMVDIT